MKASRNDAIRPQRSRCAIVTLLAALLAACGGDDPVAPGELVTIAVTPASASADVGQSRTLRAVGSALIHAQSGAVRSAPTLVLVAVPQTGALLIADSQVVAVGSPRS